MDAITIGNAEIYQGDCLDVLRGLRENTVNCCVTSPPYFGLRSYLPDGHTDKSLEIGLEKTPDQYIARMVEVFREVRRVLRADGTLWLNIGDTYAAGGTAGKPSEKSALSRHGSDGRSPYLDQFGSGKQRNPAPGLKPKDLIGIPWMLAFALRADGWYLRQDIIWHKPNPMPESVKDRCTKSHEYLFLLSKQELYWYNAEAIKEQSNGWKIGGAKTRGKTDYASASGAGKSPQRDSNGGLGGDGETRNRRSVWTVATRPYKGAHFATFPPALIEPCILAGCPEEGTVLDPFNGSGTTGAVALQHGRRYIGIELNPEYINLAVDRIGSAVPKQMVMGF